ncbi:dolichyl-phosphate-mannose-protein mannosyltransferase [Roseateles depolymerans]|uniref:Glycosyltransferase RgtA/B/C/D-like domain-containing protein n=1 Tax=Roseateles depolymerans TaxID=76731 RepID=A0A0U3MJF3_9BURK|nr:hypothetical protein RD2015_3200 [Roseateles depolymerans]REG22118.1 dolichyl-phosphate-mannose-protein mannosyltransferase [Roseateles depolymerans]
MTARLRAMGRSVAWHWPAWLLGAVVGLAYFLSSPVAGDFWWFDASRHAMNSVFVYDFFAQGGWRDPIRAAKAYYDQYPGINIGFYPPFLYLVTAPLLGVFGVSHAVCQAVVSAFAALCAMAGYAWTRPLLGRAAACACGAMLVLVPEMALWGRQVQLDVPAVALLLWGVWALAKWLEAPRKRWLWLAALLLGCAMLTRVQTVLAWPLWLGVVALHPVAREQPWRLRLGATALYGLLSLPSVAAALYFAKVMGSLAGRMPDMPALWSWANWGWYAARMPEQLGIAATALLAVGLVVLVAWVAASGQAALRGRTGMALVLGLLAWLFFSVVSNKEPRFALPVLPFAMLASLLVIGHAAAAWPARRLGAMAGVGAQHSANLTASPLASTAASPAASTAAPTAASANAPPATSIAPSTTASSTASLGASPIAVAAVLVLFSAMVVEAWATHRWTEVPRVTGHREAAMLAAQLAPPDTRVMISAHRDGNFIFSLRTLGQRPDLAVRRADKLLVDMTIMRQLGIQDRGLNDADIRALLDRERVSVVVAQSAYLADQPSMQALDRLLASGCCFELRQTVPIQGQHRSDETALRVYVRRP